VGLLNGKLLIGRKNVMKNYVYVVHRPPGKHLNKYLVDQKNFLDRGDRQIIVEYFRSTEHYISKIK
jgi:hypothetical protein